VTRAVAITNPATNVKMLITDWGLMPDVAVCDPLLVVGCPPSVTASAGVDALTHAIEAYVSQRRHPTADIFALGAIRQLYPNLRPAWRDGRDLAARAQTAVGALHAGIAFSNASVALVHGMSRPIGAYFHVPHGLSNAMLLATITAWSIPAAPERYGDVAQAMGVVDEAALPEALTRLACDLEIPPLRAVVDPARLRALAPQMARDALASGSPGNNPRVPSEGEIVELYERCLGG
jgi:alcohol dehydrogenase class IV